MAEREAEGGTGPTAEQVAGRLAEVRARVAARGVPPGRVTVVAVTKGFGPSAVRAALGAGLVDLGENYAQELVAKAAAVPGAARWHFLGPLQSNKLARLAPLVTLWQGVDNQAALEALARRAPGAAVLVQVQLAPGPGRRGAPPERAQELVAAGRDLGLAVRGLMAVGRPGATAGEQARDFASVAALAGRLGLGELSMGMSDDFEVAVAEGATMLRLGRVLFGPRPPEARAGVAPR